MFGAILAFSSVAAIGTLAELNDRLVRRFESEQAFSVTATVVSVSEETIVGGSDRERQRLFHVCDGTTLARLSHALADTRVPQPGDRVRLDGRLMRERWGWNNARVESFLKVGRAELPAPMTIDAEGLKDPANRLRFVRMEGVLVDVVEDDIDERNSWLILRSGGGQFIASVERKDLRREGPFHPGDRLELTGVSDSSPSGGRRHFQSARLNVWSWCPIRVLERAPADPFAVPGIDELDYVSAASLERLSLRAAEGVVVARLPSGRLLLRTAEGRIVGAELKGDSLPSVGEVVLVSGFPMTDMFVLHLVSARWRPSSATIADVPPVAVKIADVLGNTADGRGSHAEYYGRRIRVRGRLLDMGRTGNGLLTMESDGSLVSLRADVGLFSEYEDCGGCEVEVCGVCVLTTEIWSSRNVMPRIRGVELVVASPQDIRILSHPASWTVRRMAVAVLVFAAVALLALLAVYLRARVVKARARVKAAERMRLAAEIHDSLSQNLSGVAGQVAAVRRALAVKPSLAVDYLEYAERMLSSSRSELQRCLFDLRGHALEERNLGDAIRSTLEPLLGAVGLQLEFDVPRRTVSESTAHALLCIVRELVSNAIVHGQAKNVRVEGRVVDSDGCARRLASGRRSLAFSVADDGTGFDPARAPGVAKGHFGLQGVRERLNRLGGTIAFSAVEPHGCLVRVTIPLEAAV